MSKYVLDSSAILAVLHREPGADKAIEVFPDSVVSSVNAAEVLTKLMEKSSNMDVAVEAFELLQLTVVDFDYSNAAKTAELRPLTKNLGLSLGDRSCLALAMLSDATAVTADKAWKKLKFCPIKTIR
jgi:PIN domain nuclease of toxin-antitoxin system